MDEATSPRSSNGKAGPAMPAPPKKAARPRRRKAATPPPVEPDALHTPDQAAGEAAPEAPAPPAPVDWMNDENFAEVRDDRYTWTPRCGNVQGIAVMRDVPRVTPLLGHHQAMVIFLTEPAKGYRERFTSSAEASMQTVFREADRPPIDVPAGRLLAVPMTSALEVLLSSAWADETVRREVRIMPCTPGASHPHAILEEDLYRASIGRAISVVDARKLVAAAARLYRLDCGERPEDIPEPEEELDLLTAQPSPAVQPMPMPSMAAPLAPPSDPLLKAPSASDLGAGSPDLVVTGRDAPPTEILQPRPRPPAPAAPPPPVVGAPQPVAPPPAPPSPSPAPAAAYTPSKPSWRK